MAASAARKRASDIVSTSDARGELSDDSSSSSSSSKKQKGVPDVQGVVPLEQPPREGPWLFSDPTANFSIFSYGGTEFRIHVYQLLAASPYFRALDAAGELRSPYYLGAESPQTVEDLLTLIVRHPLRVGSPPLHPNDNTPLHDSPVYWPINNALIGRVSRVVRLCKMLDCRCIMEQITAQLRDAYRLPGYDALSVFLTAAMVLDDAETCRRVLPAAAAKNWPMQRRMSSELTLSLEKPFPIFDGQPSHSQLDVRAMPLYMLGGLPPKYIAALGRAFLLRSTNKNGTENWVKVAEEFYKLVTAQSPRQNDGPPGLS